MTSEAQFPGTIRQVGGWEWVALPDFAISCMKARLEPGSASSWLDTDGWRPIAMNGIPGVSFRIYPLPEDERTFVWVEAPRVPAPTEVCRIRTLVTLGEDTWTVELDLRRRAAASISLTLGGRVLGERFAVDPQAEGLAGPPRVWPRPSTSRSGGDAPESCPGRRASKETFSQRSAK